MVDDMWDRQFRTGSPRHDGVIATRVKAIVAAVEKTFQIGHSIQFDAPWTKSSKDAGCA